MKIVDKEPHVYLILINTPEEVVIAGEPSACERVIKKLDCQIHPISVNDVVHCEPVKKEYKEIKRDLKLFLGANILYQRIEPKVRKIKRTFSQEFFFTK